MINVSDEFKQEIVRSHRMATTVEVWSGNTQLEADLVILDGSVSAKSQNVIRRDAWVSVTDSTGTIVPTDYRDLLTPYVNELRLFRGIYLPSLGSVEYVPLGRFTINDVQIYDTNTGFTVRVQGFDYGWKVDRRKFIDDYSVATNILFTTAIRKLLEKQYPGLTYAPDFDSASSLRTSTFLFTAGDAPWTAAYNMAQAIGCNLFFDVYGVCCLRPIPDPTTTSPVWSYTEGVDGMFLYLDKHISDTNSPNHIVVIGDHPEGANTVRAEALDMNPASPTYVLGPYGDIPMVVRDRTIISVAQARLVANALLRESIGISEVIELTNIVNPVHDVDDCIYISRGRSRIDNNYIIDGLSIPMTHNRAMTISTRKRQFIS